MYVRVVKEPPLWNGERHCRVGDIGVITGAHSDLTKVKLQSGITIWLARDQFVDVDLGPDALRRPHDGRTRDYAGAPSVSYDKVVAARIEGALFDFLSRGYVQTSNRRQRRLGDVYMKAETHDLAREIAKFIMVNRERLLDGVCLGSAVDK